MRTTLKNAVFPAACIVILAALSSSCHESFEERCQREAREHTEKYCPQPIDLYQTLDSMTFCRQPMGFNYYYSMSGLMDNDSIYNDEAAMIDIKQNMIQSLKTNISLRSYIERSFTFTYYYYSSTDGTPFATIVLKPEDYQ
ncbi:MAG: hypothetical protein J5486_03215 [Bacteroidaceae bacterium]|nr:hypothetical protein [Bacteroidaceae bacterium]